MEGLIVGPLALLELLILEAAAVLVAQIALMALAAQADQAS
jgi:hypothetical protein